MKKRNIFRSVYVAALAMTSLFVIPNAFSQYAPGGNVLKGIVKSADGKPMEGVTVSIRGDGKSFTTSIFTGEDGTFVSPQLEKNEYTVWAQAVGFSMGKSEVQITDQPGQVALELKPLKNFETQLSANEWIASLPDSDPRDVRGKAVLVNNCTGCHQVGFILQNKFDASGWGAILNYMEKGGSGVYKPDAVASPVIAAYKDEIVDFLTRVRGPNSPPLTPKLLPRPTGEAAKAVITEYAFDRPEKDVPEDMIFDGTDWSQGIPARIFGRSAHDVAVDHNGNVWFSDDLVPGRTIGKLDPRTGKTTAFNLLTKAGKSVGTHGLVTAPNGNLWITDETEGMLLMFDTETEKFTRYPTPENMPRAGGTVCLDSKGNPWATTGEGAMKLDAGTGQYSYYKALTLGATYGCAVDSADQMWVTEPGLDRLELVDKAGKISEVALPARKGNFFTDKDREITSKLLVGATMHDVGANTSSPMQEGPRRMGADPNGNYVWVGEFFGDQLARIDIHTKEVKEYPLPHRYSQPYSISVDKNHMVWFNMLDRDAIGRFDPKTEQFTEFQMPTRGTEIRQITQDNSTNPPTIWVSYDRMMKIVRIQLK